MSSYNDNGLSVEDRHRLYQKLMNSDNVIVIMNEKESNTFLNRIGVIILSIVIITVAVIWYDLIKGTFRALVPKESALRVAAIITIFATVLLVVLIYLFSLDNKVDADSSTKMILPRVE